MRLMFTHSAQRDLVRLREFIADKNPGAAMRISQCLLTSVGRLVDQPEMDVPVEGIAGTRDLIVSDYVVRYVVLEGDPYILRIWHGREAR